MESSHPAARAYFIKSTSIVVIPIRLRLPNRGFPTPGAAQPRSETPVACEVEEDSVPHNLTALIYAGPNGLHPVIEDLVRYRPPSQNADSCMRSKVFSFWSNCGAGHHSATVTERHRLGTCGPPLSPESSRLTTARGWTIFQPVLCGFLYRRWHGELPSQFFFGPISPRKPPWRKKSFKNIFYRLAEMGITP